MKLKREAQHGLSVVVCCCRNLALALVKCFFENREYLLDFRSYVRFDHGQTISISLSKYFACSLLTGQYLHFMFHAADLQCPHHSQVEVSCPGSLVLSQTLVLSQNNKYYAMYCTSRSTMNSRIKIPIKYWKDHKFNKTYY
jgi:hypothetical protein